MALEKLNDTPWIQELIRKCKEMVKLIINHYISQAICQQFSKSRLLKVIVTCHVSNFIITRHFIEVNPRMLTMIEVWFVWRQAYLEKETIIWKFVVNEDWWSKIEFIFGFQNLWLLWFQKLTQIGHVWERNIRIWTLWLKTWLI